MQKWIFIFYIFIKQYFTNNRMHQSAKSRKPIQGKKLHLKASNTSKSVHLSSYSERQTLSLKTQNLQTFTPQYFVSEMGKIGLQIVDTMETVQNSLIQVQSPKFGRGQRTFSFKGVQYDGSSDKIKENCENEKSQSSQKFVQRLLTQLQTVKSLYNSIKASQNKMQEKTVQGIKTIRQKFNKICEQNNKLTQQNKKLKKRLEIHDRVSQRSNAKTEKNNINKILEIAQEVQEFKSIIHGNLAIMQQKQAQIKNLKLQLQSSKSHLKHILIESRKKSQVILVLKEQLRKRVSHHERSVNIFDDNDDNELNQGPLKQLSHNLQRNSCKLPKDNTIFSNLSETSTIISNKSHSINKFLDLQSNSEQIKNKYCLHKPKQEMKDIDNRLNQLIANISQQITTLKKQTKKI